MAYAEKRKFPGDLGTLSGGASALATGTGLRPARCARGSSGAHARAVESANVSLAQAIGRRLRESPFLPLRTVTCEERDGRVILRGRVPTKYLHAFACSLAQSFVGVRDVANKIEVVPLGLPYAPAALRDA